MKCDFKENVNNREFNFVDEILDFKIRCIQNSDGSISMNAEDICIGLGWCRIQNKDNKQYFSIRWETLNTYLKELGVPACETNSYIPEPIFYMLAMKANNQKAFKFQQWIAFDVLPSIRKYGIYITPEIREKLMYDPQFARSLLNVIKEDKQQIKELENKLKEKNHIIDIMNIITNGNSLITVKQLVNILNNANINIIENDLYNFLKNENIFDDNNIPLQEYIDNGYFSIQESSFMNPNNDYTVTYTTLFTNKGQAFIIELLKKKYPNRFKNKSNN